MRFLLSLIFCSIFYGVVIKGVSKFENRRTKKASIPRRFEYPKCPRGLFLSQIAIYFISSGTSSVSAPTVSCFSPTWCNA